MRLSILAMAAALIAGPAMAQISDADLQAGYRACMGHYHPARPHSDHTTDTWDAGFENCVAIKAEWDARGLAAAQKAASDKTAIDALASGLKK